MNISEYSHICFCSVIDETDQINSKYLTRFGRLGENIPIQIWAPPARFSGIGLSVRHANRFGDNCEPVRRTGSVVIVNRFGETGSVIPVIPD